jgi:aminoglycoside phosphotransferase (APT) family kinase protein
VKAWASSPVSRPSSAELRDGLEQALTRYSGADRRIAELKRRLSPYRSSFNLEEIDVTLEDGTRVPMIFKDLSREAMLRDARLARPDFLYQPRREIQTYRLVLARHALGTATCYGAVIDATRGRYWLFLERVPGLEIRHVGVFDAWQQAARWLADLHGRFAGSSALLRQAPALPLLRHDAGYYRVWMRRARGFAQRAARGPGRQTIEGIEWLASRHDAVVARLMRLPSTFIHGEFFACNVWIQGTGKDRRVCPVDWEMASVGPGLMDLAALSAGWSERKRSALALSYFDAMRRQRGGWSPSRDEFMAALDCCQLQLAIRMLGWSSAWSAPPQHAHNWLSEAVGLAERLQLRP